MVFVVVIKLRFFLSVVYNGLLMIFATDTLLELVDVSDSPDWGLKCTRVSMKVFPRAVGAMYTTLWSREDLKGLRDSVSSQPRAYIQHPTECLLTLHPLLQLSNLLELLKETTAKRLEHLPWLDDESRLKALKKVSSMDGRFLAPPTFFNDTWVDVQLDRVGIKLLWYSCTFLCVRSSVTHCLFCLL